MNKTEAEYGRILEAMKRRGEILRYEFQGITLRWPDGMTYTPDFAVFAPISECDRVSTELRLIEIKGARIWDDAMVKFKAARAYWPEFQFEMHQKKQGAWKRI